MIGKFESNKDLIQELTSSGAKHIGNIATIITGTVAEVTPEIGEWITEAIEMNEAAAGPRPGPPPGPGRPRSWAVSTPLPLPFPGGGGARGAAPPPRRGTPIRRMPRRPRPSGRSRPRS